MKYYFYVFSVREKPGADSYFINEICTVHPLKQIVSYNKLAADINSGRFCTLISWQEITLEDFSFYNCHSKYI